MIDLIGYATTMTIGADLMGDRHGIKPGLGESYYFGRMGLRRRQVLFVFLLIPTLA